MSLCACVGSCVETSRTIRCAPRAACWAGESGYARCAPRAAWAGESVCGVRCVLHGRARAYRCRRKRNVGLLGSCSHSDSPLEWRRQAGRSVVAAVAWGAADRMPALVAARAVVALGAVPVAEAETSGRTVARLGKAAAVEAFRSEGRNRCNPCHAHTRCTRHHCRHHRSTHPPQNGTQRSASDRDSSTGNA